jgi:phage replication O-like protein O
VSDSTRKAESDAGQSWGFIMASPQKENGYTPIANELFEAFYRCKLLEYERVCIMHIWRKTYGWNKKGDWIANSQFADETGIPRPHIARTLKTLLAKNIITRGKQSVSVNKNYESWLVEWRVTSSGNSVTSSGNESLPHQVPTKEKKEILQKQLSAKAETKMWNKKSEDYLEEDIQIDPTHKPQTKIKGKKVSEDVQAVFDLFNNPASALWRMREIERVAAQTLFDTYGLDKLKIRVDRINSEKKKKDPFFPDINTPSELLDKMPKVERYLNV